MRTLLVALSFAWSTVAVADDVDAGIPVRLVVLDQAGHPVPHAVIQHSGEDVRHEVNAADGSWEASKVYVTDGGQVPFVKGTELKLEVTAPGFRPAEVTYIVKKKKNVLKVELEPLPATSSEPGVDPNIDFGHDTPIDGTTP